MLLTLPNEIINEISGFLSLSEMNDFILTSKKVYELYSEITKLTSLYSKIPVYQTHLSLYGSNNDIKEYNWENSLSLSKRILINAALILKTRTPYKRINFFNDTDVYIIDENSTIKQLPSYSGVVSQKYGDRMVTIRKTRKTFEKIDQLYFCGFDEKMSASLLELLRIILIEPNYHKLNAFIRSLFHSI